MSAMISSTGITAPPHGSQLAGFWHPRQCREQPWAKTAYRTPGPSTMDSGSIPAILICVSRAGRGR